MLAGTPEVQFLHRRPNEVPEAPTVVGANVRSARTLLRRPCKNGSPSIRVGMLYKGPSDSRIDSSNVHTCLFSDSSRTCGSSWETLRL